MPVRDTNARRFTDPSSVDVLGPVLVGLVLAVVEPAEHVRLLQAALAERDQHLVVDLGQHDDAALAPAPGCTVRAQRADRRCRTAREASP